MGGGVTETQRAIDCARLEMERLFAAKQYEAARGACVVWTALLNLRQRGDNIVIFPGAAAQ